MNDKTRQDEGSVPAVLSHASLLFQTLDFGDGQTRVVCQFESAEVAAAIEAGPTVKSQIPLVGLMGVIVNEMFNSGELIARVQQRWNIDLGSVQKEQGIDSQEGDRGTAEG